MDLNAYWQENKRFLVGLAAAAVAFLVAWMVLDSALGGSLREQRARRARLEKDLREPLYGQAELDAARKDNQALRASVAVLRAAADFQPREQFALVGARAPANRYVEVVYDVREDLLARAGRAGLSVPPDLGLPALAPTREVEIQRHLEALDAVDRALRRAIEAGVQRVDEIRVQLDPRLVGGKPIDDLERTRVELKLSGPSQPLVRLLELLQEPREGSALLVERAEIQPARLARDEVRLDLALLVAHPHGLGAVGETAEETGQAGEPAASGLLLRGGAR